MPTFSTFLESVHNETSFHQFDQKTLLHVNLPVRRKFDVRAMYIKMIDLLCFSLKERFSRVLEFPFFELFKNTAILRSFAVFPIRYSRSYFLSLLVLVFMKRVIEMNIMSLVQRRRFSNFASRNLDLHFELM